ncbi:hypothetical protein NPIL_503651 [Nephila pilipes]|uniref:Uncharacterized protein n=1 Tax=Nephila pilipes TaxID=299642 RepID=A0A8X6NWA8_NEPPI|nr:hypothetical protein NPIL_503651 [Nephila pilipes]
MVPSEGNCLFEAQSKLSSNNNLEESYEKVVISIILVNDKFPVILHTVSVIPFSTKVINLWWLKLDLLLSSGIIKAIDPISEEASATDEADVVIIMNNTKLVKNAEYVVISSVGSGK